MNQFTLLLLVLSLTGCFRSFGNEDDAGVRVDAPRSDVPRPDGDSLDAPPVVCGGRTCPSDTICCSSRCPGRADFCSWPDGICEEPACGVDDAGPDGELDASVPIVCDADDLVVNPCPGFVCDEAARWQWNGHECISVECGACSGAACGTGPFSRAECEAAHVGCAASLCRATFGTWRFWAEECGFECGEPRPEDCLVGSPSCDCGAYEDFDPVAGCVPGPLCELRDPSPEPLCTGSGGEWGDFCDHSRCGVPSPDACVGPACHCPWPQVFDADRGCVDGEACFRGEGGCDSRSLCPSGTTCDATGACEPTVCPFD